MKGGAAVWAGFAEDEGAIDLALAAGAAAGQATVIDKEQDGGEHRQEQADEEAGVEPGRGPGVDHGEEEAVGEGDEHQDFDQRQRRQL